MPTQDRTGSQTEVGPGTDRPQHQTRPDSRATGGGMVWAARCVVGELVGRLIRVRGLAITFS